MVDFYITEHLVCYKLLMDEDGDYIDPMVNYSQTEKDNQNSYLACMEINYPVKDYMFQRLIFSKLPIPLHQRWRMVELIQELPPPLPIFH